MEERAVSITHFIKEPCKLVIRRGIHAQDYFSYCDEIGCAIWDELALLPGRLDKMVFVTLPESMVKEGTSAVRTAVEMPLDWRGKLPENCDVIDLPEQQVVLFQGMPYEEESWYGGAHEELDRAIGQYRPEWYGLRLALEAYPQFQYAASAKNGVKALKPVLPV